VTASAKGMSVQLSSGSPVSTWTSPSGVRTPLSNPRSVRRQSECSPASSTRRWAAARVALPQAPNVLPSGLRKRSCAAALLQFSMTAICLKPMPRWRSPSRGAKVGVTGLRRSLAPTTTQSSPLGLHLPEGGCPMILRNGAHWEGARQLTADALRAKYLRARNVREPVVPDAICYLAWGRRLSSGGLPGAVVRTAGTLCS